MKSQQKLILISLILGLVSVIIIMYFSGSWDKKDPSTSQQEKFKLLKIESSNKLSINKFYGQITSTIEEEVRMNVSGKIDSDNHLLLPGTSFKKNDILVKVDRLEILYELLMTRTEYKQFVQKAILEFPEQMADKRKKWADFKDDIQRIQLLPPLPVINSKEEEEYLTKIGLYTQYYKIKKLELKAQDYIYAAPFDGVIVKSKIHPGSMIKKNSQIMTISRQNSLIVKANIPISEIHWYENSKLIYYVDSNMDTLGKGKFHGMGAELSDSSTVEALFDITPQKLKDINKVVQIVLSERAPSDNGIVLPLSAVKNNHVLLFESNKILEASIQIISIQEDSITVKGLPKHCFVVIPYQ